MKDGNYRIRVVSGETQFEAEGDKAFVMQMLKMYRAGKLVPVPTGAGAFAGPGQATEEERRLPAMGKPSSVSEFIRQVGVKKHMHLVLAFGYYLEKYSGAKSFTAADINNCYYEAKMENSNTSLMITRNIRDGLMMEAKGKQTKGKKSYIVTNSGEVYIKNRGSRKSRTKS